MPKLCRGGYTAVMTLLASHATAGQRVGNDDPSIEYRGLWVRNSFSDDDSRLEALIGTNVSGSTATYSFRGTGISVYGAFAVAGTFNVRSTYSIDGGQTTDFLPPDTIVSTAFHLKFFQSDTLPDEEHSLVITNTGQDYWLDYIYVTQSTSSSLSSPTTTPGSTALQKVEPPSTSLTQPFQSNAATSSTAQLRTGQSLPSLPLASIASQSISSPPLQSTHSFSNAQSATFTSADTNGALSVHGSDTLQSRTSTLASASGTASPPRTQSTKLPTGAIAGFSLFALVVVGLMGYIWRRRKEGLRRDRLVPYDPGLTALAFENTEKQVLAHDDSGSSSAAGAGVSLTYSQAAFDIQISRSAGEGGALPEVGRTDLDGMAMGHDGRNGLESLGLPSTPSNPLIHPHPQRAHQQKRRPVTQNAEPSRHEIPREVRRRSVDGGIRLAGGLPGDVGQQDSVDDQDDLRSGVSTLPPAYQVYPAV